MCRKPSGAPESRSLLLWSSPSSCAQVTKTTAKRMARLKAKRKAKRKVNAKSPMAAPRGDASCDNIRAILGS